MRRTVLPALGVVLACLLAGPATALADAPDRTRQHEPVGRATAAPDARAAGTSTRAGLQARLGASMARAGRSSGAWAVDLTSGRWLYSLRGTTPRIPASVEKLYTTSTALRRDGPEATLTTRVLATGGRAGDVWQGDLYLFGRGDPTYGYGDTAELARQVQAALGVTRIAGRVVGDESHFDRLRGGPASGYATSIYVGPLSALSFNFGYIGNRFQRDPPLAAAYALEDAIEARGIAIDVDGGKGPTPAGATQVAAVASPAMASLARSTNVPSDNYMAEILLKGLGARHGGAGTTTAGVAVVRSTVAREGISPQVVDGSGLSSGNRTAPRDVVRLLMAMNADQTAGPAFRASLAVAGVSGTLAGRMRGTTAAGRCRAKTGTLSAVSALAGYCRTVAGHEIAFAFLMNGVSPSGARTLQDRMAIELARYRGG
jgi:serine-type D-Ala-D-Ala carboxypeptidase/endopeptidase (penicillin-binding protein 4)